MEYPHKREPTVRSRPARGRSARPQPTTYVLPIDLVPEDDGGFMVSVPSLPGCISFGETADEAIRNIGEAAAAYIEVALRFGDPLPSEIHVVKGGVAVTV